jgi:hypothetical protein
MAEGWWHCEVHDDRRGQHETSADHGVVHGDRPVSKWPERLRVGLLANSDSNTEMEPALFQVHGVTVQRARA